MDKRPTTHRESLVWAVFPGLDGSWSYMVLHGPTWSYLGLRLALGWAWS